jgi:hypothetical protein
VSRGPCGETQQQQQQDSLATRRRTHSLRELRSEQGREERRGARAGEISLEKQRTNQDCGGLIRPDLSAACLSVHQSLGWKSVRGVSSGGLLCFIIMW